MIEKQKVHLKDTGEPLRILLPIRLHQILATNPSREFVAFSVFDGSPHIPESLAMPFIVPPIKSEVFPFHGAQYANGVQIRVTKGELDILLVFDPDMSDFTELHPPRADADQLETLDAEDRSPTASTTRRHGIVRHGWMEGGRPKA